MTVPLPEITHENEAFWTGGSQGELRIVACGDCDFRIHPPQLICPKCLSRNVAPRAASGRGTIATFTINRQPWSPDLPVPYAIAIVALDDQPGVRITARIVTGDVDGVHIGQPVEVSFEQQADVFIPVFRPI